MENLLKIGDLIEVTREGKASHYVVIAIPNNESEKYIASCQEDFKAYRFGEDNNGVYPITNDNGFNNYVVAPITDDSTLVFSATEWREKVLSLKIGLVYQGIRNKKHFGIKRIKEGNERDCFEFLGAIRNYAKKC